MKEVFVIRIYGTDTCFFKHVDENGRAKFTRYFPHATPFADYSSAELYLQSNVNAFRKYTAVQIEKYFINDYSKKT